MFGKRFLLGIVLASVGGLFLTASLTGAMPLPWRSGSPAEARTAVLSGGLLSPLPEPPGSHLPLPTVVSFQGLLTDPGTGLPIADATYSIRFSIWDGAGAGTEQWNETQNVTTSGGLFDVLLGSVTPLTTTVFDGDPRYLEVKVGADPAMTPRQRFVTVPYAFFAEDASLLDGIDSTNFALIPITEANLGFNTATQAELDVHKAAPSEHHTKTVDASELGSGTVDNTEFGFLNDVTSAIQGQLNSDFWKLGGNSGTTPGTDFLGTTDNQALELQVNGSRALRLEPDATSPNVIGGFSGNSVTGGVVGATIGGGGLSAGTNRVTDDHGTVGGGLGNQAGDNAGTTADRPYTTVGGGFKNTASGQLATVSGGANNTASGLNATVGGGTLNIASGVRATVAGGVFNTAAGDNSFAAGRRAKVDALHDGSFLFADQNNFDFNSAAANEFAVRSTGGARFVSGIDGGGNPTAGVTLAAGGGSWSSISDRSVKANFESVDGRDVLEVLAEMPIETWNYDSQDPSIRHIGPVAQDFYAAFGVGEDERLITTVDADGVALAAIQGLYELVQEKDGEIAALEERLGQLEQGSVPNAVSAEGSSSSGLPTIWLIVGGLLSALVLLTGVMATKALGSRRFEER